MAIIDAPAALTRARFALEASDTVSETRGVYDGVESRLDFGGEWWRLTIVTGVLSEADQGDVFAWCDLLRDADAVARIRLDPVLTPLGTTAAATIAVTGAASAGQRAVAVDGLGAGATLLARSYLSTPGDRLHRLRVSATADGAGAATLELFPRLRDPLAPGAALRLGGGTKPAGLWRLQGRPAHALSRDVPPGYAEPQTLTFLEALA